MLHQQTHPRARRAFLAAALLLAGVAAASAQQPKEPPKEQPKAPAAAPAAPAPSSQPQAAPAEATPKEVTLTQDQIQHVLDAQKDFTALVDKLPKTENANPDPKIAAEFEATAKKHGFDSYAQYNDVVFTMSDVLNGIDPKTKTYVGPAAVLKQQLAAVQADTKIPEKDKKAMVDEINDVLKSPPPSTANKANVDLVTKNYDKIAASLQQE